MPHQMFGDVHKTDAALAAQAAVAIGYYNRGRPMFKASETLHRRHHHRSVPRVRSSPLAVGSQLDEAPRARLRDWLRQGREWSAAAGSVESETPGRFHSCHSRASGNPV